MSKKVISLIVSSSSEGYQIRNGRTAEDICQTEVIFLEKGNGETIRLEDLIKVYNIQKEDL